jgi:hypothetical protein
MPEFIGFWVWHRGCQMHFIRKGEVYNENHGFRSGSYDCILDDLLRFDDGTNLVNGRKLAENGVAHPFSYFPGKRSSSSENR